MPNPIPLGKSHASAFFVWNFKKLYLFAPVTITIGLGDGAASGARIVEASDLEDPRPHNMGPRPQLPISFYTLTTIVQYTIQLFHPIKLV